MWFLVKKSGKNVQPHQWTGSVQPFAPTFLDLDPAVEGEWYATQKMVLLYPYSPKKYGKAHLSQGFTRFHYNRCGRFFSHPQSSVGGFPPGTGLCAILEPRPSQGPGAGGKMGKIYREKDDRPDMFHELHTRWGPQLQVGL